MSTPAAAPTVNDLSVVRETAPTKPKAKRAPKIFAGLLLAAAAVGGTLYVTGRGKEKTDNAQVETHVASIATRVPGQVRRVLVDDNQAVKAGTVLVELDDADYGTKVAAARADLAAANANRASAVAQLALTQKQSDANIAIAKGGIAQASAVTGSTRAMIDQANADVAAAEAHAVLAKIELTRTEKLVGTGAIPIAELDTKRATNDAAIAQVSLARARVVSALSNRDNSSGTSLAARGRLLVAETAPEQVAAAEAQVALADAKVEQAKAALHQAELNFEYTKIRADSDGIVAKRNVEPGQMVSPERPLMAVVASTQPWIIANFKETQLEHIKPGDKVKIGIDGFDDADLEGKVVSIQAGTGSRFSLLPPDNASGNFTKVTQRVPVRIEIAGAHPELRAGMSAEVTVYTAE